MVNCIPELSGFNKVNIERLHDDVQNFFAIGVIFINFI
jgi:hypothetical protein